MFEQQSCKMRRNLCVAQKNTKLVLLGSYCSDLLRKKCCFACYFAVDLSIVLSCKSEFNAYLFVYCFKNFKLNFVRLLVRCSFQWCNFLICFPAVCWGVSVFSYALSENVLMYNFLLGCDKRVKPVLLPLYSCLVSMIIFLDLFS